MYLKRIAWRLGITKKIKIELSELIYERGVVAKKFLFDEYDKYPVNDHDDLIGIIGLTTYDYHILFKGEKVNFFIKDRMLFDKLERGADVIITYREKYKVFFDYTSENFDKKQEVKREFIENIFVNAKIIKEDYINNDE
ncbi:MAG: hypothetical protein LKI53_04755 [Bacteroidales bacterium]|jgi:hypothetical protein|nr:hypothetical protein [Bacteroidales bacterium]